MPRMPDMTPEEFVEALRQFRESNPHDPVKEIMRRLGCSEELAKQLVDPPTEEAFHFDMHTWLRFVNINLEPWDDEPELNTARDQLEAVDTVLKDRAAKAGKKSGEARRHPRRNEALDLLRECLKNNPGIGMHSATLQVTVEMDAVNTQNVPHFDTIARWYREENS